MYFRKKISGGRAYLQIVASRRDGGQVRQQVIATLGRYEDLRESGQLERLLRSGARFSCKAMVVDAVQDGSATVSEARRLGPALVFERLWEETGCRAMIEELAGERKHEFALERAVFLTCIACSRAGPIGRRTAGARTTGSTASRGSTCITFIGQWRGWARNCRVTNRMAAHWSHAVSRM